MIVADAIAIQPLGWLMVFIFFGVIMGGVSHWMLRLAIRWEIAPHVARIDAHELRIRDVEGQYSVISGILRAKRE